MILAPIVRGQKGEFKDFFADMSKRGFVRARVDGGVERAAVPGLGSEPGGRLHRVDG